MKVKKHCIKCGFPFIYMNDACYCTDSLGENMKKKNTIKKGWKFDPTKVKHVPVDNNQYKPYPSTDVCSPYYDSKSTITEKHYTIDGDHPEDRIYRDKEFINRLQKHIDLVYDILAMDLDLNEKGKEWLFDFVYNEEENIEFEEYLAKYNVKYCDLVE
jgi:hypothetical protein